MAVHDSAETIAGRLAGQAFRAVSTLRGGKSLHPRGISFAATLSVNRREPVLHDTILGRPGEHDAIIRFSRAIGLPPPLPDFLGATIRLTDAYGPGRHQDLLLVTSRDRPVLHHLLVPVRDAQETVYSSLAPYRVHGRLLLFGLKPCRSAPRGNGATVEDRLIDAAATGRLRFELAVSALDGRFRPVGLLDLAGLLPRDLDHAPFNVWNTGGGLEPATWVNRIRREAYAESQRGWDAEAA